MLLRLGRDSWLYEARPPTDDPAHGVSGLAGLRALTKTALAEIVLPGFDHVGVATSLGREWFNLQRYAWTIGFSAPGFDCLNGVRANVQGTIQGLTLSNAVTSGTFVYCTRKMFGNIPITIDGIALSPPYQNEDCAMACGIAP